ncbi:MAG: glycerol-3-phosphate acyltransferase, partial [Deltaproteobacteria bacterium]
MRLFQSIKGFVPNTKARLRKYINCLLGDTQDYSANFYPENQSYIIKKIMTRLVTKLSLDDHNLDKIKNIEPDSIVVFASKNKRLFDFLYFHTRLKALDLPFPELGFDFRFFFLLSVKRAARILLSHLDYFLHHFHVKDIYTSGFAQKKLQNKRAGFVS